MRWTGAGPGFTLLELLVVLAITGAVVVGLAGAVHLTADVAARGADAADDAHRREAVRSVVRRWLASAYSGDGVVGAGFDGRDDRSADRDLDVLSFSTLDPGPLDAAAGERLRVRLRIAEGDSGLVADYTSAGANERRTLILLPEARGLEVRYLVAIGDAPRWLTGWSSTVRLPRAVELRLQVPGDRARSEIVNPGIFVDLPGAR